MEEGSRYLRPSKSEFSNQRDWKLKMVWLIRDKVGEIIGSHQTRRKRTVGELVREVVDSFQRCELSRAPKEEKRLRLGDSGRERGQERAFRSSPESRACILEEM